MNTKNKQGLVVMRQKLSLAQQNNRLTIDDGIASSSGAQEAAKLKLLSSGPPIQKPEKSRFDNVKKEAGGSKEERRRKRRSRWAADAEEKITVPGMSTNVPSKLNPLQQKLYVLQLQVEDCTRRLRVF